ncbi:MAG: extracellular solute-binding protein [Clostridiales bacterium]|nr:extracellular solute-binding protein [Clostridiales bacterium]
MKKALALLMLVALLLTTIPAFATEGSITLTDEPMTITLWDIATDEPDKGNQEGAVQRFMEAYPNITVEVTHTQNDSYKEKLIIAMSSGQCPDMYIHWGGGPMIEYINSGFATDMTDLYEAYNTVEFLPSALEQCKYEDKIYAIPYGGIGGCGIFYNKAIFEKVGIEVPTTITELEAACDKLVEEGYVPFALANSSKWTGSMYFMYLATRYGGTEAFANAVAGTGSFTDEAFMYAAQTIQDWVNKGYFPEGVNSLSPDDGQDRQLMYQEKAAMMLHGSWQARSMASDNEEWYNANIDYFAFPALEDSSYPQNICVGTSIGNGFSFNVPDNEEKRKALFVLATQFYNDDMYNVDQLAANLIPSIVGIGDTTEDHCMQQIWADFSNAPEVQLWYDQYLPPEVSEAHKDLCQAIFGLTMTPLEANQGLQDAMAAYNSK